MLSKEAYKVLVEAVKLVASPQMLSSVTWDKMLKLNQDGIKHRILFGRFGSCIRVTTSLLYCAAFPVRIHGEGIDVNTVILPSIILLLAIGILALELIGYLYWPSVIAFINKFLQHERISYALEHHKISNRRQHDSRCLLQRDFWLIFWIKSFLFYAKFINPACVLFLLLVDPLASELNMYYHFVGSRYDFGFIYACVCAWLSFYCFTSACFLASAGMAHTWSLIDNITRLTRANLESEDSRMVESLLRYRSLQILQILCNYGLFEAYFGLIIFSTSSLISLPVFTLVSFRKRVDPFSAFFLICLLLCATVFMYSGLKLLSQVDQLSGDFLRKANTLAKSEIAALMLKSMHTIKFEVTVLPPITRMAVLIFFSKLFEVIVINLILSFGR